MSQVRYYYNLETESICTHYSNLSGQPDISLGSGTFKTSGIQLFEKAIKVQKTWSLLCKNRSDQAAFFFFNNNDLGFLHMLLKKAGCKKTGSLLFKKKRDQAASSIFE